MWVMLLWLVGVCFAYTPISDTWPQPVLNTSFVAQGVRPGVKVGMQQPLAHKKITREGLLLERRWQRIVFVEPSLMIWYHWGNMTPLTLSAQLHKERVKPSGWTRGVFIGQGATWAFNAGVTYHFDDAGELVGSRLAGRLMSATSVGMTVGRDLSRKGGPELAWHVRPTATFWAPYNAGFAPVLTLEIGVRRTWDLERK
ncbi:MAG: hypothetical protein H6740_13355 [Alphaproteobacteria bacterium]|nr:hypothetical protein [Alphaproteobacteria bacterium]